MEEEQTVGRAEVSSSATRKVEARCIWVIFILGLLQAINSRFVLSPDGISYLDLGELWLKGDVGNAVNAYWHPVYPILLGLASKIAGNPLREPMAVHLANVAALALNLFLFRCLLREIRGWRAVNGETGDEKSESLFTAAAYLVFFWCHREIGGTIHITPDLLVTSAVLGAAICLMRLLLDSDRALSAAGLGIALGVGYWVKAIMFVTAPFFLFAAIFCAARWTKGLRNAVIAGTVFAAVSAPYVILVSRQQGHWTYSEAGKLAYFWMVNSPRPWFHWQGAEPGSGTPIQPTRQLLKEPEVYEFGNRPGTYPVWFDPAHWHKGLKVQIDAKKQLKAINLNLQTYFAVFFQEPISIVLLALFGIGASVLSMRTKLWPLLIPGLSGVCVLVPVYALPRHLAPFLVLLYLTALAITWRTARRRLPDIAIVVLIACGAIPTFLTVAGETVKENLFKRYDNTEQQRVAIGLQQAGLRAGDRIAVMGRACDANFARLARVKIVAEAFREAGEIPTWARDPDSEARTVAALKPVSVKAIVRDTPPKFDSKLPWQPIGNTRYSVLFPDR